MNLVIDGSVQATVRDNLTRIREELADAAKAAGIAVPRLLPVTKSATPEEFLALMVLAPEAAAENRVQMWQEKVALLEGAGLPRPEWHIIGSLQTNKVKYVIGKVAVIESLDSEKLAREIGRLAERNGIRQSVLLEINSGREPGKGGVLPEDARSLAETVLGIPGISLRGIMTMGPVCESPDDIRPYFELTRKLFDAFRDEKLFDTETPTLSMGMSGSYRQAVAEGANLVRIGRALFRKTDATLI